MLFSVGTLTQAPRSSTFHELVALKFGVRLPPGNDLLAGKYRAQALY